MRGRPAATRAVVKDLRSESHAQESSARGADGKKNYSKKKKQKTQEERRNKSSQSPSKKGKGRRENPPSLAAAKWRSKGGRKSIHEREKEKEPFRKGMETAPEPSGYGLATSQEEGAGGYRCGRKEP